MSVFFLLYLRINILLFEQTLCVLLCLQPTLLQLQPTGTTTVNMCEKLTSAYKCVLLQVCRATTSV